MKTKTFHPIPHFISDFQSFLYLWYYYLSHLNFIVINNHILYSLYNIQNIHTYNLANKFFRHVPFPYFNSLHKLLYFSDSAPLPLPRLTVQCMLKGSSRYFRRPPGPRAPTKNGRYSWLSYCHNVHGQHLSSGTKLKCLC